MEVTFIRAANLILFGVLAFLIVAVPMVILDSHAVPAKKHMGPVPFPPNLIPHPKSLDQSHKHLANNQS